MQRLRSRQQSRADADLAAAIEESKRIAAIDEDDAQLAEAIRLSLAEVEASRADQRHDDEAMLRGIIDSLHEAPAERCDSARREGRSIARHLLEAHLVTGGGF